MEINVLPIILGILIFIMIKQVVDIKKILNNMDMICIKMINRYDHMIDIINSMKKPKSKKKVK